VRNFKRKFGVVLFGLLGIINTSQAALNDLGNGLVNDTTLNITWMQDANLVKTSCDTNNALWQAFNPSALPAVQQSGRTKLQICGDVGRLNWFEAEAWIAVLNAQNYLGHNDWRQPATPQPDLTCELIFAPGNNGGFNCRVSELGNLFNVSLGNPNDGGTGVGLDGSTGTLGTGCFTGGGAVAPFCFQNTAPFSNAPIGSHWSGNEYAPNTSSAWLFSTESGRQGIVDKVSGSLSVWPVRSGQSADTPQQVPTLSVWGLGLMSLLLAFVARRKRGRLDKR